MKKAKLFASVIFILSTLVSYACYQHPGTLQGKLLGDPIHINEHKQKEAKGHDSFGKIRLPADVFIDLVEPIQAGAAITLVVSASSKVPVHSGVITLKVPAIGEDPNREEILWSGNPSDFVSETLEYTLEPLPEGQYRLIAILRFTPDRENAKELALSRSLYVDVRPDAILSSNISFTQIKRLELRKELEERVMMDLLGVEPETANSNIIALKIAELKASDPNIIESRIAELIATDPNIAHRILQLNREKADISADPNEVKPIKKVQLDANGEPIRIISPPASGGKPTIEEPVPIPDWLKDIDMKNYKKIQKAPLHGTKQAVTGIVNGETRPDKESKEENRRKTDSSGLKSSSQEVEESQPPGEAK